MGDYRGKEGVSVALDEIRGEELVGDGENEELDQAWIREGGVEPMAQPKGLFKVPISTQGADMVGVPADDSVGKVNVLVKARDLVREVSRNADDGVNFVRKVDYPLANVVVRDGEVLNKLRVGKRKLIIKPVDDGVIFSVERVWLMDEYRELYGDVQALLSDGKVSIPTEIEGECVMIDVSDVQVLQEMAREMWIGMEDWQRQYLKGEGVGYDLMTQSMTK